MPPRVRSATPPPTLPELAPFRRPRLRPDVPVLWRGQDCIQVGDDIVIDQVTRSMVAWLTSLDGRSGLDVIEESLTIPESDARRLVRAVVAAGALEDAARIPDCLRWAPQPRRDALTQEFWAALHCYRDLDTAFDAMARRERIRVAVVGDGALAHELSASLSLADSLSDPDSSTIAILANSPHPDVPAAFDDPLLDRPHLHVGCRGDRAVVGPLVIPGRTACLRCGHLHRRDADAAWPLLSVQWAQAGADPRLTATDPLLTRQAATMALLLVRAWADQPDDPSAWSGFAVDLRLPLGLATREDRPPHPLCGCRWTPA